MTVKEEAKMFNPLLRNGTMLTHIPEPEYAPIMPIQPIWETQAELYMEGLKAQIDELEAKLKDDEELEMICYQGNERLSVIKISMPSHNVIALQCVDAEKNIINFTGHIHAVTFSLRILKPHAPVKRNKIGFCMRGE